MPRTLWGRLALAFGAIILVVAALTFWILVSVRDWYADRLTDQLANEALVMANASRSALVSGASQAELADVVSMLASGTSRRFTFLAPDGTVITDSAGELSAREVSTRSPEIAEARNAGRGDHWAAEEVAVAILLDGDYVARVAIPREQAEDAIALIRRTVLAGAAASLGLIFIVGAISARSVLGPLQAVRERAVGAATGRSSGEPAPTAPVEVADISRVIDTLSVSVQEQMAESERERAQQAAILASLRDGVVTISEDERVLHLNDAAAAMFDIESRDAIGRPLVVVTRDHDLVALVRAALETGEAQSRGIEYARAARIIEAAARPVSVGETWLAILVLRDVTTLRHLESVRREFVANVSHELRTPLASVRALVETLQAGAADDPEVAEDFLQRIVTEVDRLTALSDELLDLARLESGRMPLDVEEISVREVIERAAERLRPQTERARLHLVVDIPVALPRVAADRSRIEQVLLNLIHNAIKFTPPGGTITVSAHSEGSVVRVAVSDTGVGISPGELPRIFERFHKADRARRSEGSGLGLAIAKHIVQAHRGTIEAASELGRGTTITFTLPVAADRG